MRHKIMSLLLAAAVIASLGLCSCGKSTVSAGRTVFKLNKDGTVTHTIVENNEDGISQNDLTEYINQQIAEYAAGKDEAPVRLKSCKADSSGITIEMDYDSISDYAAFNKVPAFEGNIGSALTDGYLFDSLFYTDSGKPYSGYTLPVEYPQMEVLVLQEPMNVVIPEKAVLFSDTVQKNDDGTYTITESEISGIPDIFRTVNMQPSYILFKAAKK